jgi:radical SAM superfamily enzyme YgiQ (UPF0313 family)
VKTLLVIPPRIKSRHRDFALFYSTPHIGIAALAALLRKAGHEVRVIDAQAEELSFAELKRQAARFGPEQVGITAYTEQIEEAHLAGQEIKRVCPESLIVVGGCHASALPRETLEEFPGFDLAVQGEGEIPLLKITQAQENGQAWSGIPGIAFRDGGEVRVNPPGPVWENLDLLPIPAFDLFPLSSYRSFHKLAKNGTSLAFSTQRGCPYSCIFCYKVMGSSVRSQSAQVVLDQVAHFIRRFDLTQVGFLDDNFTLDRDRTFSILAGIEGKGFSRKVHFGCQTRVDLVDQDLLKQMGKSGFFIISYGVESGQPSVLERIGKKIDLAQAQAAISWSRAAGISTQANFIIGYPFETRAQVKATINFALKLDPDFCVFSILTPFPGTPVREMVLKGDGGGRLISRRWSHYGKHMGRAYETSEFSRANLERLQSWAYMRFYLRFRKIKNLYRHLRLRFLPYYLLHQLDAFLRRGQGQPR